MLRRLTRTVIRFVILLFLVFLGLSYYFRHITNFRATELASYHTVLSTHHIHPLSYGEVPDMYRNAVIATEDRRFWWDPGVDPVGIARSLWVDVQKDQYVEGGSTVTQQLVDNTLIPHGKSLLYKTRQVFYAFGVYDTFSKQDTFDMYANVIYFGNGAYGLYNASMTYFGRPPSLLNDGELTMLAGIPNAPADYNPEKNFSLARARQALVLQNMVDAGLISKARSSQIFQQPIHLKSLGH